VRHFVVHAADVPRKGDCKTRRWRFDGATRGNRRLRKRSDVLRRRIG
jgi:hypothetical protein